MVFCFIVLSRWFNNDSFIAAFCMFFKNTHLSIKSFLAAVRQTFEYRLRVRHDGCLSWHWYPDHNRRRWKPNIHVRFFHGRNFLRCRFFPSKGIHKHIYWRRFFPNDTMYLRVDVVVRVDKLERHQLGNTRSRTKSYRWRWSIANCHTKVVEENVIRQ